MPRARSAYTSIGTLQVVDNTMEVHVSFYTDDGYIPSLLSYAHGLVEKILEIFSYLFEERLQDLRMSSVEPGP